MDILQRAANLFDRAQGRVTDATNQAVRLVMNAAQMRALEARQAELRQQLEQAAMELGKLTFQRWKSHGVGNEHAMTALCRHIDRLNAEYQQVLGALTDARAATYAPPPYPPQLTPPVAVPTRPPPYPAAPSTPSPYAASYSPPPAQSTAPPLPPPLPPRPLKPARECPECYSLVPGTTDFCPSCGMRV